MPNLPKETYTLCEVVADMALNFAHRDLVSNDHVPEDSRELVRLCIGWAVEFEAGWVRSPFSETYIEAVDAFFEHKYAEWFKTNFPYEKPNR